MPRFRNQHPNRQGDLHQELRRHPVIFPGFQPDGVASFPLLSLMS